MAERKHGRTTAGSACRHSARGALLFLDGRGHWRGLRDRSGRKGGFKRGGIGCGFRGAGLFFEANDVLIGDFPAEMLLLAVQFEVLLEKDGAAGISHKGAGSRQKNIAGAVLHLDPTPEKG